MVKRKTEKGNKESRQYGKGKPTGGKLKKAGKKPKGKGKGKPKRRKALACAIWTTIFLA